MDKLKQFDTPKTYLTLSGLLAGYLLLLLFQSFFNNQIGKLSVFNYSPIALLFIVPFGMVESDRMQFSKIATLGLAAIIVNIQLNLLHALNQPDSGNGFQMASFFGLALAGITVLCHYDLKKTGRTRLDYTVVSIGFFFFFGLLAATEFALITS